jgi:predicted RNase H-like HicB family nuclease
LEVEEILEVKYTILIEKNEEGSYTVTVPSLPGCVTQGDTPEEAIANAQEAIIGYIEALKDIGKPVPVELPATM